MPVPDKINLILIDDEILIRQPVKILLESLGEKEDIDINIYSASNGVEGMGLIYIVNPEVIILDTTLPKYSGRELIEFLTTNPKFNDRLVFVLHDGNLALSNIPSHYIVLNKKDSHFVYDLSVLLGRYVSNKKTQLENKLNIDDIVLTNKYSKFRVAKFGIRKFLIQQTLIWGNRSDLLMYRISNSSNLILKGLLYPFWVLTQLFSSFFLSFLMLVSPKIVDSNITQGKLDLIKFRVKTYPTLATLFIALIFLIFQAIVFIGGGLIIFNNVRVLSVLADVSPSISLNFSDAIYNANDIEITAGVVRLKENKVDIPVVKTETQEINSVEETPVDQTNQEEPANDNSSVPEVVPDESNNESINNTDKLLPEGSVQGANTETETVPNVSTKKYTNTKPEIIFNQKISFDKLLNIYEESTINSAKEESLPDMDTTVGKRKVLSESEIQSRVLPSNTISYQISPDKINWFYYGSEGKWEKTLNGANSSNTIQEINQFLKDYVLDVGGSDLYLKAFLHSDGNTQIELRSISINREIALISNLNPIVTESPSITENTSVIIPSYPTILEGPISFPKENNNQKNVLPDLPVPTIFNASFVNGKKLIGGKVLNTNINDSDLGKFKIRIYTTTNTNTRNEANNKGLLIGTVNLERNSRGELTFFLEVAGTRGGFVVAELTYSPEVGMEFISDLSKPLES